MKSCRNVFSILALAAGLLVGAPSAHAATTAGATATIAVTPGGYNISVDAQPLTLGAVTLDGLDHTVVGTTSPTFTVYDATGSNAGWNVTFSANDFSDGTGTIAAAGFTFSPVGGTVTRVGGQAVDGANGPKETGSAATALAGAGFKVVTTVAGYGKGRYTYQPAAGNFSLLVPAATTVGAGNFQSTLTATITSGP